jgi:hypothetical protein
MNYMSVQLTSRHHACKIIKRSTYREICGTLFWLQSVAALQALYSSVDEIDLFAAAVAEKPLPGALLGQTFVCLVGDQFARLRRGDRFYYEEGGQPSSFSPRKYTHQMALLVFLTLFVPFLFTTVTMIHFQHLQAIYFGDHS